MPRKKDPEERARFEAQKAQWARNRVEFEEMYERLKSRWREQDEEQERRRARLRRLTLGLLGR
jgi:hypothetical protein